MNKIIVGKRVTVGAVIGSIAVIFAHLFPVHAAAIISASVPVTFFVQLLIVRCFGVTQ